MNTLKAASLSIAVVLATALSTAPSFAQALRTAASPTTVSANTALPWAVGVRVPLTPSELPAPYVKKGTQSPWTRTTNNPPINLGTMLLLTDGTVIAHEENDQNNNVATTIWYKLTPDINGSYINGTWSQIASLPAGYGPLFFGSAVLPDGRVVVEGGEYNQYGGGFTKLGAIYDPAANTWTSVTAPTGWNSIGDASTVVLSTGALMLANTTTTQAALLNPLTLTWTATGTGKFDINDEEGWTLLPNGKVLTVDAYVGHYQSTGMNYELYDPSTGTWSVAGTTPVQLWDSAATCGGQSHASFEVGPAILLPNGTIFATGANSCGPGHTAIYNVASGTWTAGPDFPGNLDIADGPAALEPNGKMLMMTSPLIFNSGSIFFEWDGSNLTPVSGPPNAPNVSSFQGHLLVLPTGQIMYTDYTNDVEIFTPTPGNYNWVPAAYLHSLAIIRGNTYVMVGTKLNGLSQATAYGDDLQNATNYPIVRLTNVATGHVFYCRTHGHSTMAVGFTGLVKTQLDIPASMEAGVSYFEVVANGIPSQRYTIQVQ
ncbi:MAG TPA: hypothetical protein VNY07_15060 [Chthoniobacterales bacterium]|nr:hypothetical protein [Chthoniobacterales bacterium]